MNGQAPACSSSKKGKECRQRGLEMNSAPPQLSCLSLLLLQPRSSAGAPKTSTISPSLHQHLQKRIWFSQPHFVFIGFKVVIFPQAVPPFCFLPREKRVKMQRKDFIFFFKWRWREGYWNKPKQEPGMTNVERKAQNNQNIEHRFPHNAAPKKWEIKQEIKKCFIKAFSSLGNSLFFFFFNFKWNLQHSKINKSFSRVTGVQNVSLHSSPTDLNWNSNLALAKVYNHLNSSAVNQKVLTASTQARVWRSPSMMQPSGMKYLYGDLVLAPHCQYQGKKFPLSTCAPSHLSGWGQMRPAGVKKLLQCTVR